MRSKPLIETRNTVLVLKFNELLKNRYTHGPLPSRINCVIHELSEAYFITPKTIKAIVSKPITKPNNA